MGLIEKARAKQSRRVKKDRLDDAIAAASSIQEVENPEVSNDVAAGIFEAEDTVPDIKIPEGAMPTTRPQSLWENSVGVSGNSDYKTIGETMYDFDYNEADIDALIKDTAEYAITCLKSGMDPKDLDEEEIEALEEIRGPTWYLSLGFTEDEVYDDDDGE
jgi:hypothetical protein